MEKKLAPCSDEIIIVGHEPDLGAIIAELLSIDIPCRLARGSSVTIKLMHSQILSVIPECFYRGSMISVGYKLDSRSESLRE